MTDEVWGFVILAAFGHAIWNVAARQISGEPAIMWWSFTVGALVISPFSLYLYFNGEKPIFNQHASLCLLATGIIHAVYFLLLSKAYLRNEVSFIYPISRGSGVGLTAIGAFLLLDEPISIYDFAGICMILAGILAISLPVFRVTKRDKQSISLAIGVGLTIVSYSLIDKIGVSQLHPVHYILGMYLIGTAIRWPWIWAAYRGRLFSIAISNFKWITLIGVGAMGTYLLILYAYTLGPVSHIVAIRESSVIIAFLIGIIFLNETFTKYKFVGTVAIVTGLVLIKIG